MQQNRQDNGTPHVEYLASGYEIVITERGLELERFSRLSRFEAAKWFLFGLATGLAQSAELKNRKAPLVPHHTPNGLEDDGYSRWNWMAPCIETMYLMSAELGDYAKNHYLKVLKRAPLEDYEKRNAQWDLLS